MIAFAEILARVSGLTEIQLERWVALGLVEPEPAAPEPQFDEIDVARVTLMVELRRDFELDDEALSLVLPLIDQVHDLRRDLNALATAIARQPEPVRRAIAETLAALRS